MSLLQKKAAFIYLRKKKRERNYKTRLVVFLFGAQKTLAKARVF